MSARHATSRATFTLVCLALAAGCGGTKHDPSGAPLPDCSEDCGEIAGGPGSGGGSDAGTADATTDAGADAGTIDVEGSIGRTVDDAFFATGALAWPADVTAYADATGATKTASTSGPSWAMAGLAAGSTWFAIKGATEGGKSPFLPTMMHADVETNSTSIDLLAVDSDVLTATALALSPPQTLDTTAAQVIVTFETGTKLTSGVVVSNGFGAVIAYDAAPGYQLVSQGASATLTGGTALLLNMPAQAWPGAIVTIPFTNPSSGQRTVNVRVASGFVTRVFVAL